MKQFVHYDIDTKEIIGFYKEGRKNIPEPVATLTTEQFASVNENQYTHVGDIIPESSETVDVIDPETDEVIGQEEVITPAAVVNFIRVEPELTPDEITRKAKVTGFNYNGQQISLDKDNQHGVADILTGVNLAAELGQEAALFPIHPLLNSPDGEVKLTFTNATDYKTFALQFMSARQQFYT